jgi:hypothetical protein
MRVAINHPTDRPNFTEVQLGDVTIWFSYRTPIAFLAPGKGKVVRENEWGPTTGKHLGYVDSRNGRVSGAEFEQQLEQLLSAFQTV